MEQSTDLEQRIVKARNGDADALEELLNEYRGFLELLIRSRLNQRLRSRVDSSDLVQETLVRAAKHLDQFEGTSEEEWRGWLGRIAEREVIHQYRHHVGADKRTVEREQSLDATVAYESGNSRLMQWWAKDQSSPSQVAMRNERALILSHSLDRLADDQREVLVLRHLEGCSFAEIGERLNRSAGAVRVLWMRALKKLREALSQTLQNESSHV